MTQRSKSLGSKLLVAAACAATLAASAPIAQISAYSTEYIPSFGTTLSISDMEPGISGTDYVIDSVVTANGEYIVLGMGEVSSAKDQVVIAKYSSTGDLVWGYTFTSSSVNSSPKAITPLANGNYLIAATVDGESVLMEIAEDGSIVETTELGDTFELIDIAEVNGSGGGSTNIIGVTGDNKFYVFTNHGDSSNGYRFMNTIVMDSTTQINSIRSDGNGGFVAVGFDTDENSSVILRGDSTGSRPTSTLFLNRSAVLYDVAPYNDGYVGVGHYSNQMKVWKISSTGSGTAEYSLEGQYDTEKTSAFTSVDVLSDNSIVAVGFSNYDHAQKIEVLGGQDAVVAHLNGNLSPISVNSYGGDDLDNLTTVKAAGNAFYIGGLSRSSDIGIEYRGNEIYSIIGRFANGVAADVTFHVDGEAPEGVDLPEDGTYHWNESGDTDLPTPNSTIDHIFSGWYTDEDLENELGDQIPSDDLDLYGKYYDVEHDTLDDRDTFDEWCEYGNGKLVCTNPEGNSISEGETSDPNIPRAPSGQIGDHSTARWISDDPSIATVDQDGRVTGVSEGTTNIRFVIYDLDGNIFYEYVLSYTVKAAANPDTIDTLPIVLAITAFSAVSLAGFISKNLFGRR